MLPNPARSILIRNQLIEVRTADEIAATLDADGKTDGLPFMPEMIALCGQRFRVYRRAEKTCVEGHGLRAMHNTVLLQDVYCDGGAHDGCQRKCRIFWKEGWLKPVDGHSAAPGVGKAISKPDADLERRLKVRQDGCYVCQSTELPSATINLSIISQSWSVPS